MTTQAGIVNAALELTGDQVQVTGSNPAFDGTPAGNAAGVLYTPALQLLLRMLDPDFARATLILSPAPAPGVVAPWSYEYVFPADCLRLRQVRPPVTGVGSLADPFDPRPVRAEIAYDPSGGGISTPAKVILTNQQNALLVYTTSLVTEAMFDPVFIEALTRRLANPLAMALAGRPDFARELLEEAERYAQAAGMADDASDGGRQ